MVLDTCNNSVPELHAPNLVSVRLVQLFNTVLLYKVKIAVIGDVIDWTC